MLLRGRAYRTRTAYLVRDGMRGQRSYIDEFTGRISPAARWSAGSHQASEAKEASRFSARIRRSPRSLSMKLLRMYAQKRLGGMTRNGETEAPNLQDLQSWK